jgi:hypothetical protein
MSRAIVNKPSLKSCDICGEKISLYSFSSHLKWKHALTSDKYACKYGEFRKQKSKTHIRSVNKIECKLCNNKYSSVGFFVHLRDTHSISPDDYVIRCGEYRSSKLKNIEYKNRLMSTENKHSCVICGEQFASGNLLGWHIKKIHKLDKPTYVKQHIFNNTHPLCECGCGKTVKLLNYYPYRIDYITGHNSIGINNPMYGKTHKRTAVKKMSDSAVNRKCAINTIDTEPELCFESLLNSLNIKYKHPYVVDCGDRSASVDFYLQDHNMCIEIDGEYWHPTNIENLNFKLLSSVISDRQKNNTIDNIYRIRESDLSALITNSRSETDLIKNIACYNKINHLVLGYDDVVINKEYFSNCIIDKGQPYVESFLWLLKKFIRNFQPEFPYPPLYESIELVMRKIREYDYTSIYNAQSNEFSNNIYSIGNNYLKHHFHSYWGASYKGNVAPKTAWEDESIMHDVIKYRIGCNNSGEIFDFSLHQLIQGLSARRITVSFFKPLLAAAIYHKYLGDTASPVVLDPCCGFGGRLLGFKSKYPNGTYIGCEPNVETFGELQTFIKNANLTNVEIHNCKFEEFSTDRRFDLIFTSIPYYDLEIYSNSTAHGSFNDWKNTFIAAIEKYSGKKCYINVSSELSERLNWTNINSYIVSNTSHFDKNSANKREAIVEI